MVHEEIDGKNELFDVLLLASCRCTFETLLESEIGIHDSRSTTFPRIPDGWIRRILRVRRFRFVVVSEMVDSFGIGARLEVFLTELEL